MPIGKKTVGIVRLYSHFYKKFSSQYYDIKYSNLIQIILKQIWPIDKIDVQLFKIKVDLWVMAIMEYSTFPRGSLVSY